MTKAILKRTFFLTSALAFILYFTGSADISASENSSRVFINEICAENTSFHDDNGNYFDWIELYNASDEIFDLSGYGLSEKEKNPFKYTIPEGTAIKPHGRIIIYCNKEYSAADPDVACFSLSNDGETITLTDPYDGTAADKVTYPKIKSNTSYGRVPDGSENFSFLKMSPGNANNENDVIPNAPEFSHKGGFYDNEFDLEITADPGCAIYYTLDGSTPTTESILYDGAINIYDRSADDNYLSLRTDISAKEIYTPPAEKTDKATVIKAISVSENGNKSEISAGTYFIGYADKADYYRNWKIISIITDESNLFGDENGDGIYIMGRSYNDWYNSDKYDPSLPLELYPANYRMSGSLWERPASFQIIENGSLQLSQDTGIRIHGGWNRCSLQKSFNIYARSRYGSKKIEYDLFSGGRQKYDSIILRNGGNDSNELRFRDKLNQELVKNRAFLTQEMEPCIVFINGEYWGHYEITEKISADYIKKYEDIEEENLFLMKNSQMINGEESDLDEFNSFSEWIKNTDFSDDENYRELCDKIDIQNYIDYMCSEIYIANEDWVNNNIAWFKEKGGKYKFIMFDAENRIMPRSSISIFKILHKNDCFISNVYESALSSSDFKKQFCNTFMDILNDNFNKDKVNSRIDEISEEYRYAVKDYYKRFGLSDSYDSLTDELKLFYSERSDYAVEQLGKDLELSGTPVNVTIENDNDCGTVALNTITPETDPADSWRGRYFTDYPITLNASVNSGHEFSYFELSGGERIYSPSAEINLTEDVVIKAVYDAEYPETTDSPAETTVPEDTAPVLTETTVSSETTAPVTETASEENTASISASAVNTTAVITVSADTNTTLLSTETVSSENTASVITTTIPPSEDNEETSLPQTGNNNTDIPVTAAAAVILTSAGIFAMKKSGAARTVKKCKNYRY